MFRRNRITGVALCTVLGLLLLSCAPAAAPTPTTKPPPAPAKVETPAAKPTPAPASTPKPAEQPRYGGHLALPALTDPPQLDPHRQTAVVFFGPMGPVYNGIVQYDYSNKVVPDLAERWEVSPDGKVYTFHLRRGVKWHDGKPFTSADAKFSLTRIREYETLASLLAVDTVETPDENTLKVTLQYRQASFLTMLGHGRILMGPQHVFEATRDLRRNVIGTGPFKLKEYVIGASFRLEKNKEYFVGGRPYLDTITFYIIRDPGTRFAAFRTGRLHIYGHPPALGQLTLSHVDIIKREMPQVVMRPYEQIACYGLLPNWRRAPWSDVRVRRAAFLAIDREKAVEVVSEGVGDIGVSVFYGEWALPKEEMLKMLGFRKPKDQDIAEAKRLLAEAGYPQGFKSTTLVRSDAPMDERAAIFAKDQLAKIGIDLTIQKVDYAVSLEARERHLNYDTVAVYSNVGLVDPDITGRYIHAALGKTFAGGEDDQILELYRKQSQAATIQERKEIVFQLQRRIAEVVPHIMFAWHGTFIAFWPEVENYPVAGIPIAHTKLEGIWLAK